MRDTERYARLLQELANQLSYFDENSPLSIIIDILIRVIEDLTETKLVGWYDRPPDVRLMTEEEQKWERGEIET